MRIAVRAGEAIMDVYSRDFKVEYKDDSSPLTEADKASHEIIDKSLKELALSIPVVSEESASVPYSERSAYKTFWSERTGRRRRGRQD